MKRREHWLKSIIEWQNEFLGSLTAQEFVDGITGDLLGRGVFVFTPRGEILRLPKVHINLPLFASLSYEFFCILAFAGYEYVSHLLCLSELYQ